MRDDEEFGAGRLGRSGRHDEERDDEDRSGFWSRGVPFAVAIPVFFGMLSIIGAITTWALAGLHERQAILDIARLEWKRDITADDAGFIEKMNGFEHRLNDAENQVKELTKQVNQNTGQLNVIQKGR